MKKSLMILTVFLIGGVLALGMVACSDNPVVNDNTGSEQSSTVIPSLDMDEDAGIGSIDPVIRMSASEKQAVYEGTYGKEAEETSSTYYGVGRTINVITDPYIDVMAGHSKIFDVDKLLALNWNKSNRGQMESYTISGNSMEETFFNFNNAIKTKVSTGLDVNVFSLNLETEFGNFVGAKSRESANEVYFSTFQTYYGTLIEIDEYYDLSQFTEILSYDFIADIEKLQNGNMYPASFVAKYGTHVVLAGYYGGKLNANYYMKNIGAQWDNSLETSITSGIGINFAKILNANVTSNFSIKSELGLTSNLITEQFSANSVGGANFSAVTISDFLDSYDIWVESMNEQTEFSNIIGMPARSLAAIWDLFPVEYREAKIALNDYFHNEAKSVSDRFLSQYEKFYAAPVDEGDTINYAGGFGTEDSPYLVETVEHFKRMKSNQSSTTHYKLINSLDLGVWNTPFSFTGYFDGNGNTISFYQTLAVSGNCYGGLFSTLTSSNISNLYINANISENNKSGHSTAYVGALAGKTSGTNTISKVVSKGIINLANGEGTDYIGGIIGYFTGGLISESKNEATVESHAYQARTGGIVGYACPAEMAVNISNSYNEGHVKACTSYIWGGRAGGGIVGQVRGHSTFILTIYHCYNNGTVETKQEKNAALGWWGCGGLFGDINENYNKNIQIQYSYWNTNLSELYGNNEKWHGSDTRKANMTGTYNTWSSSIWEFSVSSAPRLKWIV